MYLSNFRLQLYVIDGAVSCTIIMLHVNPSLLPVNKVKLEKTKFSY